MISKEKKAAIIKEYARTEGDTGSPEVQVARTNRRHGRGGAERAAGHSCISCICSDFAISGCGSVVIAYH